MDCQEFKKYEHEIAQGKRWCYDCEHFYTDCFCSYEAANCRIYGSLDCDQHERHPDTAAMTCPDYQRAKRPLWFLKYISAEEGLKWSSKLIRDELENLKPKEELHSEAYNKISEEVQNWPEWRKEIHDLIACSKHAKHYSEKNKKEGDAWWQK